MDHEVAVVHEHPGGIGQPLGAHGLLAPAAVPNLVVHLVDQGAHVAGVAAVDHDEGVDDAEDLAHVHDHRALTLLVEEGLGHHVEATARIELGRAQRWFAQASYLAASSTATVASTAAPSRAEDASSMRSWCRCSMRRARRPVGSELKLGRPSGSPSSWRSALTALNRTGGAR